MTLNDIASLITGEHVSVGFLPDLPDATVALFDYSSEGDMTHYFDKTDCSQSVQVRVRDSGYETAYERAEQISKQLNRFSGAAFSVLQTTPILDIGQDTHNPPRREFTINFKIIRRN